MIELAERNPTIGVVSAYRLEESRVTLDGLPPSITVVPGREMGRSTLLGRPYPFLFGTPSSVLIASEPVLARDPFYNEDNPWDEDTEACLEILRDVTSVSSTRCLRSHAGSTGRRSPSRLAWAFNCRRRSSSC
jgi:hypothetical protein